MYFDTAAFRARGHVYGKLNPWAVGSMLAAEGEVGGEFACTEKRNPQDFALWKVRARGVEMLITSILARVCGPFESCVYLCLPHMTLCVDLTLAPH